MPKIFNVTANCDPALHYMVDITGRLEKIRDMVDRGDYFTINRARQYGKTTTLIALSSFLKEEYEIISLDFQMMSESDFDTEYSFVRAFAREILFAEEEEDKIPTSIAGELRKCAEGQNGNIGLASLFAVLSRWCGQSQKPIVLLIDEVDQAANYQVFLDFLGLLRGYYIRRKKKPTFQSVILAGVYDIKNLKRRFAKPGEHSTNSPWNIAADYLVDMSFSAGEIAGMLQEYENDHGTGMDISAVSRLIYDYTSGYPYLVSRICKLLDERLPDTDMTSDSASIWTVRGVTEAAGRIVSEDNTLFDSLEDKVNTCPELEGFLQQVLMNGKEISNVPGNTAIGIAKMFGFVRVENNKIVVANRIFETRLYNMFLTSPEMQRSEMYARGDRDKYQFVKNDELDMKLILERFVVTFDDLYGDRPQKFVEEDGRRYFLLYLRPIINGIGNYYIESRTRNQERTDIIVDYRGKQYVCELKIWHGNAYHERGEQQLRDYLDYYHLDKGYMLSFNFNQKKEIGVKEVCLGEKILVEAVV